MQRPDVIFLGRPNSPSLVLPTNTVQALRPGSPSLIFANNAVQPLRPGSPTLVLANNNVQPLRPGSPTLVLPNNAVQQTYVLTNEPATQTLVQPQPQQVITRSWKPAEVYYSTEAPYPGASNTGVMVYIDQNKML